jgi:hypothetical protein
MKKSMPSISSTMFSFEAPMTPVGTGPLVMAIPVVEFSWRRYKIRMILNLKSTYPKEIIEF